MILRRTSPPSLEPSFEVFDNGVFTPNDRRYVSWHWADFPNEIDVDKFRLTVRGHVNQTLSLSTKDILQGLPHVELAAVRSAPEIRASIPARDAAGSGGCNGLHDPR
jgi:DMSO/TMAO reductase YedYZ molybdopterin-dependent catalytic subunit